MLLLSCRGEEVIYPTIGTHITDEVRNGGLYILCEGNMGSNKARLDYMNLESGEYYSNWYGAMNPKQIKELGDVGNDIQQYGGRLYAVINCSHKIEVMDLKARHIGQVDIPNCRYMAFKGGKAYVSAYVGSIADPELLGSVFEIDTATLEIKREVKVGHQPDQLCIVEDKLYVCNSGGYLTNQYDSTVSVIDLASFTEVEKIPVGLNPTRIKADNNGRLWIACQGNYSNVKPQVVVLDNYNIVNRFEISCLCLQIQGNYVYILDHSRKQVDIISISSYACSKSPIDISNYENPYGLLVTDDAVFVTDAKNYVSSGVLHCYNHTGEERWNAKTGDIPGHLCKVSEAYDIHGDTLKPDTTHYSPYIHKVYEYLPGMGQFVNMLPKYEVGDDIESMCRKCEAAIANNAGGMITLGGWGGYVTFGFDHSVQNEEGYDLRILGNAFLMSGNEAYGSSEPGIVMVSRDENRNGKPDDTWYELKGCLYEQTEHNYTKTYTRSGDTLQNQFHMQPYYPQWIEEYSITLYGSLLPPQSVVINNQNVQHILEYGYVDNKPNTDTIGTSFDISWAVDTDGKSISLPCIDFVRIYTAVDEILPMTGELSTEVSGAIDLHINP